MKYIFLGSPPLAAVILRRLVETKGAPELVVTQEAKQAGRGKQVTPTAVEVEAKRLGLSVLATSNLNDPSVVQGIKQLEPELLLVAAFGQIFKEPILAVPKRYCLNVHTSLLPRYRGAGPIQRAIWNGDKVTGVSIQKMVKRLDAGDVLLQKHLPIEDDDTSETLLVKLAELGAEASIEAFTQIEQGTAKFSSQDESQVTLAPKIDKEDALIQWAQTSEQIHNQVRALQPWPIAETLLGAEKLKIYRTAKDESIPGEVGAIATDAKSYLKIKCGDGLSLRLLEVQLQNRKRVTISQFLAGYRGQFPYSRLG